MTQLKEKLAAANKALSSEATPKESIPDLKKKRDALELAIAKEEADIAEKNEMRARGSVALKKLKAEELAAKEAAKKARIRKQLGSGKRIKRKAKGQVKSSSKSISTVRIPKAAKRGKKRVKTFKVPKYVKSFNTGRVRSDLKRDMQRTAMEPGKHKQKRGSKHKFYYEKRANRTDVSPKWKLKEGGSLYHKGGSLYKEGGKPSFKKKDKIVGDYAIVARTKDDYLFVLTKPVTNEWAKENFRTFTQGLPSGEVGEIMKIDDIRNHKKVIGLEYLNKNEGGSLYRKGGSVHPEKVGKVMREFKHHKLKSHGKVVTDRDQAIAIALSEANLSKSK